MVPLSQTADRRRVFAFQPLKVWSCWTKVYQTFARCSQIIADETFERNRNCDIPLPLGMPK